MLQRTRHKLYFGPYKTPTFKIGQWVQCARRGKVQIVGLTDGRIQWPIGQKGRTKTIVLYAGLAEAVRRESGPAVMHWWGFASNTLWTFRRALGLNYNDSDGLRRLRVAYAAEPWFKKAQLKAWATVRSEECREKIAAAKRGKPRPPEVIEAIRKANLGRKHTAETRANMSAERKRRGLRPPKAGRPWTAEEDAILRRYPLADVAKQTGRTMIAASRRRRVLGLPDRRHTRGQVLED